MPELERTRDPLGAGRGKSFREQAGNSISRVQKHIHDKYYIPPYRPTNRNWEMTFSALGYNRRTIEKFWRLFCQINNSSGAIQLEHFLEHFDLDWTPWTERCFTHFDTTGGGDIDFLEFMISVWNICTFKIDSLSNFTFDMYDLDSDGELSIPEIEGMVKELFGEDGGKQCLGEAIEFAEARGGALNLNSFIAFTGSHQLLLFPMFQIQRKLQRKVFGVRFWEKVERASKENFNGQNKNEFNPRHVQVLLRTYQTGGAVAVLSHTGDPNKGLRDWYENQKDQDGNMEADDNYEAENGDRSKGLQRWSSIRDSKAKAAQQWDSVRRSISTDGNALKQNTIEKIRELRPSKSRRKDANNVNKVAAESSALGENNTPSKRPASAIPANVAKDLARIRARRKVSPMKETDANDESGESSNNPPTSASLPAHVADDLQRIRARRMRTPPRDPPTTTGGDPPSRSSTRESQRTLEQSHTIENGTPNNPATGPTSAGRLPPNVAADLERIRARRTRRATRDDRRHSTKVKRNDRPDRPRPRTRSTAIHNNVRQRQSGSMFFKSEGQPRGWLE